MRECDVHSSIADGDERGEVVSWRYVIPQPGQNQLFV